MSETGGQDQFQNHRAGYGTFTEKLTRLCDWLTRRPDATLASGEGALLLIRIREFEMLLELLADNVVWVARDDGTNQPCLCVRLNDVFAPAADGHDVEWSEVPELLMAHRANPSTGVLRWAAQKRGLPLRTWRGVTFDEIDSRYWKQSNGE